MFLEKVTAEIRPRTSWEAMDLGIALARRHFPRLLGAWFVTVIPFCVLIMVLLHQSPIIGILIIRYLKPLFDRVPLWVLSRELFGSRPTYRSLWKALPRLMWRGWFSSLVTRRLSPIRSYLLPVIQLEQLKGKAYRRRAALLTREGFSEASWMMGACVLIEAALTIAGFLFVIESVPEGMRPDWDQVFADFSRFDGSFALQPSLIWILAVVYILAMSIVENFYVAAGFGLYINSRTQTEGWDIELAFRRLQKRLQEKVKRIGSSAALMVLIVFGTMGLVSGNAFAQVEYKDESVFSQLENEVGDTFESAEIADESVFAEEEDEDEVIGVAQAEIKERIGEVLTRPEFEIHETTRYYFQRKDSDKAAPDWDLSLMAVIGKIFFWLLVALGVILVAGVLWRYRHLFSIGTRRGAPQADAKRVQSIMGMNITREGLPSNVAQAAWERWLAGDRHQAASLLYRGALSWFVEEERLPIIESDTESDCLRHVRKHSEADRRDYFIRLTRAWVQTAYGKEPPVQSVMEALCRDWPYHSNRSRKA